MFAITHSSSTSVSKTGSLTGLKSTIWLVWLTRLLQDATTSCLLHGFWGIQTWVLIFSDNHLTYCAIHSLPWDSAQPSLQDAFILFTCRARSMGLTDLSNTYSVNWTLLQTCLINKIMMISAGEYFFLVNIKFRIIFKNIIMSGWKMWHPKYWDKMIKISFQAVVFEILSLRM